MSDSWVPPNCSVDQQINPNDWPPSLHAHYRRFNTTTGPSAPLPRIGTQALAVPLLRAAPLDIGTTGSHVTYESLCCVHAAYMPDAAQPVTRYPLNSSRAAYLAHFRHRLEVRFDTSSAVHLRSSPQHSPDALPAPFFSLTLTTTALNGSSSRRFEGCVWTPPPRGRPSSLVQHCIHLQATGCIRGTRKPKPRIFPAQQTFPFTMLWTAGFMPTQP